MENKYSIKMWEDYYSRERKIHIKPKSGFFVSYDIFLCDSILNKHLPFSKDKEKLKVCEIGCGDGKLLKKIADHFNYEPFGIEYSSEAAKQAKEKGIEIFQGDAFDRNLLEKYKESFDVVYSYGFVEHIFPPEKALAAHLFLLKKGGYFFIQIPRLKGFNRLKAKIFRPDLLPLHNLKIMEEEALRALCKKNNVEELYCKNYGTIKLRIPMPKRNIRYYLLKAICALEYFLNPMCRILFRERGFETKLFSPCVIFIGRKT